MDDTLDSKKNILKNNYLEDLAAQGLQEKAEKLKKSKKIVKSVRNRLLITLLPLILIFSCIFFLIIIFGSVKNDLGGALSIAKTAASCNGLDDPLSNKTCTDEIENVIKKETRERLAFPKKKESI